MKHFILWPLLLTATYLHAQQLYNYNEVKSALKEGNTIRIVTDFSQCSPNKKLMMASTNVGIFSATALQILDNSIVTSMLHFTINNPLFPDKPVYEFVRYQLKENGILNLSYIVLNPVDYSNLTSKLSLNCPLNSGAKIFS